MANSTRTQPRSKRPARAGDNAGLQTSADPDSDVPVVGPREPCPCGSGRRYKACHGRPARAAATHFVARPFAGLADEGDWVALREFVPAGLARLTWSTRTPHRRAQPPSCR